MEDHQSKRTESEHLEIEMDVLVDKNCPTTQFTTFPFSAKRLSTDSQSTGADGHQTVGHVLPSQEKDTEARHDCDMVINRSSGSNTISEGIVLEESVQLCHGNTLDPELCHSDTMDTEMRQSDILDLELYHSDNLDTDFCHRDILDPQLCDKDILGTQMSEEDNHGSDTKAGTVNFQERHDLQFKRLSKHLHSTQVSHGDVNKPHVKRRASNRVIKASRNRSYFLPRFEPIKKQRSKIPERIHESVHSSKNKSNRSAKQLRATLGDSTRIDGEYWRKVIQNKDDEVATEESGLEPKRQWYRAKRIRPQRSLLPSTSSLEFWLMLLPLIMMVIIFVTIGLLWKYIYRMLY